MKALKLIPFLAGWGLCFAQTVAVAQEYKEHISKQYTVKPGSAVAIYNLDGFVKVEGYAGDKVVIEIDETIKGKTEADLELGKKEFKLGFDQKADSLIAYTSEPYDTRPHLRIWNNRDERRYYIVKLEYTVKVPNNVNLIASTVNEGFIDIKNVSGSLKINNVNGPISIANAKGTTDVHTINGNLTVTYLAVPPDASSYYTLNGKLEVTYPANLSANLQFKSMNGQFYTDFDNTEFLPTQVEVTHDKRADGTTYKLNKHTPVKVGAGGKLFKFETLNGNIYIKKQS
jgi:hypothetical protein